MLEIPVGHAMFLHVSNGLWSIGASGFDVEVTSDPYRAVAGDGLVPPLERRADARDESSLLTAIPAGLWQNREYCWFQDAAITSSGLGLTDVDDKGNLDILQQDRDGTTLRRWSLSQAWPVKFVAGDWDNEADENVIKSVMLTCDFFELVQ